jgi:hypothetical protein
MKIETSSSLRNDSVSARSSLSPSALKKDGFRMIDAVVDLFPLIGTFIRRKHLHGFPKGGKRLHQMLCAGFAFTNLSKHAA